MSAHQGSAAKPPRVFISYAEDNEAHQKRVIEFATVLRTELGIDAHLDVWYTGPRRDWSQWAVAQLAESDFVLAIASPGLRDRLDGRGDFTEGRAGRVQAGLLRDLLTKDQEAGVRRILPIVLPGNEIADIPQLLFPYSATHYVVRDLTPAGLIEIHAALASDGYPVMPPRGIYREPEVDAATPTSQETLLLTTLRPAQRGGDIRFRPADINGHHYGESIVYRPELFCQEPRGAVEYTIGRRFRQFEAMAGVLDDAREGQQRGHFQVFVDGRLRARASTTLGKPARFRVDVTGVLRLRLVAYRADTVDNAMLIGAMMTAGKSGNMPELAWGDPTLSD